MSASEVWIRLGPLEVLRSRPFTHPDRNAEDLAALRCMRERLCHLLHRPEQLPDAPRPLILYLQETDGRSHRVVLSDPEALLAAGSFTVVGFFGQRRSGADLSQLDAVDLELVAEFPQHPTILSYSSLELPNGDWGNLVLLSAPEGIDHWRTSVRHIYAARRLAPQCYEVVRLHNGTLPGRLMSEQDLVLLRTKYYDYRGPTPWYAMREMEG